MRSTFTQTPLLLFGDQAVEKLSSIQSLVRHSKTSPLARMFLQQATDVVQLEFARLSAEERGWKGEIHSLLGLAEENVRIEREKGEEKVNGIVATVLMCVGRIGELCIFAEEDPSILGSESSPTHILAFCTGLLPAAVAAAARDTSEILRIGLEMIRITFRLAYAIIRRMKLVEDVGGNWATTVLGVGRRKMEEILTGFHTEHNIPEPRKVAIGVEAGDWLTLVGPPSSLRRLWSWSTVLDRAAKTKTDTNGAIHTEHMPTIDAEEVLDGSVILDIPLSSKTRIGRNSRKGVFTESTLGGLLREMIVEIAHKVLKLSATIEECISILECNRGVKLTVIGPTGHTPTVQRLLQENRIAYQLNQHSEQQNDLLRGGSDSIAIVGMSGRFPASETIEGFWENLLAGKSFIREVPKSRWDVNDFYDPTGKKKNSTTARHGSWLDRPGLFDNKLFNISPREAIQMDPIQRLLLTTSYEALEVAGYSPDATPATCSNRIATYLGQAAEDWHEILNNEGVDIYYVPSISRAFGPSRLNYHYKWGGGSYAVDSACATSTTAISLACSALKARECDTALAGGGSVLVSPNSFSALSKSGMISTTGGCRTYHDDADGYARGEAVAVVVLKRLEDAISDNDNVLGVIRGSARTYSSTATSITHPDGEAQKRVCDAVLRQTCVDPLDISYVEMHGTGTQAGDAIEMGSVLQAVGRARTEQNPLMIGAVKANVGHGEGAAGVTSLVKVLMMLRDREIPPQPDAPFKINRNFPPLEKHNVHIAGKNMKLRPRPGGDGKARVLLNSFDASGGNTALLVEDAPQPVQKSGDPRPYHIVTLSARSSTSLRGNMQRLLEYLERHPETQLADLAYTTTARRIHQPLRTTYVAATASELVSALRANNSKQVVKEPARKNAKSATIYAFTGQGGKCSSMGEHLYKHSATFRRLVTTYQEMANLQNLPQFIDLIANGCQDLSSEPPIRVHLAIVTLEVAIAQTLNAWGVRPDLVMGHSLGEYAALAVAGVLSMSDTLHLVGQRALLVEKHLTAGEFAMLAVQTTVDEVQTRMKEVSLKSAQIACINAPTTTVVSSNRKEADQLQKSLLDQGVKATMLNVSYGFHSKQVEPILQEYESISKGVVFNRPTIPIASTLLGTVVKDAATFSPLYLARQTREPVNFTGALYAAANDGFASERTRWVEVGPESLLSGLIRATLKTSTERVFPVLKSNVNEWRTISICLAAFYESGIPINWPEYHRDFQKSLNLLHLPTYAFEETEYWTPYREPERKPSKDSKETVDSSASMIMPKFLSTSLQRVEHERTQGEEMSVTFTSRISQPDLLAAIQGHIVDGITVCPLGVFGDMALTASSYIQSKLQQGQRASRMAIHDIELTHPLVVEMINPAQIVTVAAKYAPANKRVKVSFSSTDGKSIHQHGECQVSFDNGEQWKAQTNQTLFLARSRIAVLKESARLGNAHRLLKPMVYKLFANLVWYGDKYCAMDEVLFDAECQDVVANVTLPLMEGSSAFQVNPYWMDSTVHAAGFLLNGIMKYAEDTVCLSTGFKSWRPFKELSAGKSYTSYVCMQETDNGSAVCGDAYVFDGEDLVLATLGLRYQKMKRAVMRRLFLPGGKRQSAVENVKDSPSVISSRNRGANGPSESRIVKSHAQGMEVIKPPSPSSPSTLDSGSSSERHSSTPTTEFDESSSEIISKLLAVVAEESGCDLASMDEDTDFTDMGLDSLMAMTTIANLKNDTGFELPATFFIDNPTIGAAKAALRLNYDPGSDREVSVESAKPIETYPSLDKAPAISIAEVDSASEDERKVPQPAQLPSSISAAPTNTTPPTSSLSADIAVLQGSDTPSARKIFLMPDWSGSSVLYIQLPPLGENLCVYGLESPYKKPNADTNWILDDLTDLLLHAIRKKQAQGPYVLGGASFGALHAAKVARKLLQMGEHVHGLLLVGMFIPQSGLGMSDGAHGEETVLGELERAGYVPALKRMTKTQREHLGSTVRAHSSGYKFTGLQNTPGEGQPAKTVLIRGKSMSRGGALPSWLGEEDKLESWRRLVGGEVECQDFEAENHALLKYPHINVVGQLCKDTVEGFLENE